MGQSLTYGRTIHDHASNKHLGCALALVLELPSPAYDAIPLIYFSCCVTYPFFSSRPTSIYLTLTPNLTNTNHLILTALAKAQSGMLEYVRKESKVEV